MTTPNQSSAALARAIYASSLSSRLSFLFCIAISITPSWCPRNRQQASRRQWLIAQQLATETDGQPAYRPDLIATLRRRELLRVGAQLSGEVGMPFVETGPGDRVDGLYRRRVDTIGGRYALIEKSREFTLVPWRPLLDHHVGKPVSGILRGDRISWSFGRGRGGPSIG